MLSHPSLHVGPAPWNHLLLSLWPPPLLPSPLYLPLVFLPFIQHFPPLQWPRQWDPGCSQPQGPSSRLSLFTVKPKGSRVNPTTWHASLPAKGMPMSASIAALLICCLLFVLQCLSLRLYVSISHFVSPISWLFHLLQSFFVSVLAHSGVLNVSSLPGVTHPFF